MDALKAGSLTGAFPLLSGSCSTAPQSGVVGSGGGANAGAGGASEDGRRKGLFDANSGCVTAASLVLDEPTGFLLMADGEGG
jgi:hypothetical protein